MSAKLQLSPGFRFHPTDDELVKYYLSRKCLSQPIDTPVIAEIDLYSHDPWELPALASYGEKEWYFFTPRDRKYPNGSRPNRSAGNGYWKATGADKGIGEPRAIGIKKSLVFYAGRGPSSQKTNWIMHEYRLANVDRSIRKGEGLRLDDWVLCRIYNKKGIIERPQFQPPPPPPQQDISSSNQSVISELEDQRPTNIAVQGGQPSGPLIPVMGQALSFSDYMLYELSDSVPKLHTDSSCSDHVVSPEFTCEVQSEPSWNVPQKAPEFQYNYIDPSLDTDFGNQFQSIHQFSAFKDIFMPGKKPF